MNLFRVFLLLYISLLVAPFMSSAFNSTPFFLPRSQNEDSARWLAGWAHEVNRWDINCHYGTFAITPEVTHTFNNANTTRFFFGEDLFNDWTQHPYIKISGSRVNGRNTEREWLADYFGLPLDFESILTFNPNVTNFLIDFNVYIGLNQWRRGMYLNFFGPFVYTRTHLNVHETVLNQGSLGYPAGYFSPSGVPRSSLLSNALQFLSLQQAPTLPNGVGFCPLEAAIMSLKPLKKIGFADIQAVAGWNFIEDEEYHLGLNLRMVIPTGNRPKGRYLFEPIVGNGHFFEAGVGVSAHALLWRDQECSRQWGFYLEGWVTHMFETIQFRSFDLKGADNSRYMLAQLLTDDVMNDLTGNAKLANYQFNNVITPVANISTLPVRVSVPFQADLSFMFNYYSADLEFDIGYNFWTRKPERVRKHGSTDFTLINELTFAVKGDAQLFGFVDMTALPVALSATQSMATITGGLNYPETAPGQGLTNAGIDNPQLAFTGVTELLDAPTAGAPQINTSIQPILLTRGSLSPCRSSTHGWTQGIFSHVNFSWESPDWWYKPYLGIGIKVELSPEKPNRNCPTLCTHNPVIGPSPCGTCDDETLLQCGYSQWAIWIKSGISFN